MQFVDENQYLMAWTIYVLAGIGFCMFWWHITSGLKNRGWQDIIRGFAVIIIFTPWHTGDNPVIHAPAVVILLLDVMLEGISSGLQGGIALLSTSFMMLIVLTARQFKRLKPHKV